MMKRDVAVLLEKHPPQHVGRLIAVASGEVAAIGQIPEDRIRLGQVAAIGNSQQRHFAGRIHRQVFVRARLAGQNVDFVPDVVDA